MEANELRIGNYVTVEHPRHGEQYIEVESITNDTINIEFRPYFFGELQPIQLTSEWFKKLNAEKDKEYNTHYILPINEDYGFMLFAKDGSGYNVFIHIDDSSILLYNDIMYVHELQNVYWALSGEELIFN